MIQIHKPVLLQEVIEGFSVKKGKTYVDATLGFGGHALAIIAAGGDVVGIDRDTDALTGAKKLLEGAGEHLKVQKGNFRNIDKIIPGVVINGGILADIGVSSYQLDTKERGFSFKDAGPLDMRMDREQPLTAREIVNTWEETNIAKVIREYGEERFANRIAVAITRSRKAKHIETTGELAEIVAAAIPRKFWPKGIHPATRTFQGIRIAVNDELGALSEFLPKATGLLQSGARLIVITFHSLEDRIVKDFMKERANPCICPPNFPKCNCDRVADVKIITKKPITAREVEINENPRSRSAKLRILEKL
jgi:16S rRNA (cytosine1402-N4)-methyltransferase